MKYLVFAICIFGLAHQAYADTTTPAQTIRKIATGWNDGAVYIDTVEGTIVENCNTATLRVDVNNMMRKEILAIALSAYHTGSNVQFRVVGCWGDRMNATAIVVTV